MILFRCVTGAHNSAVLHLAKEAAQFAEGNWRMQPPNWML
jgi:hypothetical protein